MATRGTWLSFPIPPFLLFSFFFSFSPSSVTHKSPHLAKTQKMELFIPSMACMSAALGSNSQRDRLTAVVVRGLVPSVHWATA